MGYTAAGGAQFISCSECVYVCVSPCTVCVHSRENASLCACVYTQVLICSFVCMHVCVCEQRVKQQCKPPWCEPGFSLRAPSRFSRFSASHYLSTSTHQPPQTEREEKKNIKDGQWDCCSKQQSLGCDVFADLKENSQYCLVLGEWDC